MQGSMKEGENIFIFHMEENIKSNESVLTVYMHY